MLKPRAKGPSISRQCKLLAVSRSLHYYKPRPQKSGDFELMRLIDRQFMGTPAYGSRAMRDHLRRQGLAVNRKRVRRLMRLMGISAVYPKPRTSAPHPGHKIYPYLLKDLTVGRPNQVWASDITCIPMRHGFMYLVAVMDWYSFENGKLNGA